MRRAARMLVAGLAAVALAAPAAAPAATYCVDLPGCDGIAEPTIADAATAAGGTPERDTIRVGPGVYQESPSLTHATLEGSGAGATAIKGALTLHDAAVAGVDVSDSDPEAVGVHVDTGGELGRMTIHAHTGILSMDGSTTV